MLCNRKVTETWQSKLKKQTNNNKKTTTKNPDGKYLTVTDGEQLKVLLSMNGGMGEGGRETNGG